MLISWKRIWSVGWIFWPSRIGKNDLDRTRSHTVLRQEWLESGVILGVVLVNASIGFIQESKALKAIEALARATTGEATVLPGGSFSR